MLRLWREGASGAWHASLQLVEEEERIGFADLECLFAYLLRLTVDRASSVDHGSSEKEQTPYNEHVQ
jgi:hypothetical protein